MDRVAGLEADDALPAALGEDRAACRPGRARARGTAARPARRRSPCRRGTAASARTAARRRDAPCRSCGRRARPRAPCRSRRRSSTSRTATGLPVSSASATRSPDGAAVDGEADGQRPRQAARRGAWRRATRLVVGLAHEALERRERAGGEHVEVGELARGQLDGLERGEVVGRGRRCGRRGAAVRLDQAGRWRRRSCRHLRPGSGRAPRASRARPRPTPRASCPRSRRRSRGSPAPRTGRRHR